MSNPMPDIWTNPRNLVEGHVCPSPLRVKGQSAERPTGQKGSILFSLPRGSKFFGLPKLRTPQV